MFQKKHYSFLALATLTSNILLNNHLSAKILPLNEDETSEKAPVVIEKQKADGTYVENVKVLRDEILLNWKPYLSKATFNQKAEYFRITHLYKKINYSNGTNGVQIIGLVSYSNTRAQILNAIEFSQKLLSLENNDLVTVQISKTFKNNEIVNEKISLVTNKEDKKLSFEKPTSDSDVEVVTIKDGTGKSFKVVTYKDLPIDLVQ